jgi:protein-disulfide isomerase
MRIFSYLIICVLAVSSWPLMADGFSQTQVQQVEQIAKAYMLEHPEILQEMMATLRAKEQKKQMTSMQKLDDQGPSFIRKHAKAFFNDAGDPVVGNAKGTVTLVEFFDYRCGHCREMSPVIEAAVKKHSNLRVVYKELPIFGGESKTASLAALAANRQGKYEAFHHALMSVAMPINEKKIMEVARSVGLDTARLTKDMASAGLTSKIEQDLQLAQDMLKDNIGYTFTPIVIVSNADHSEIKLLPGAVAPEKLAQVIAKMS